MVNANDNPQAPAYQEIEQLVEAQVTLLPHCKDQKALQVSASRLLEQPPQSIADPAPLMKPKKSCWGHLCACEFSLMTILMTRVPLLPSLHKPAMSSILEA